MGRLFASDHNLAGNLPSLPAVFPDQMAPVVLMVADERVLGTMRWSMPGPPQFGGAPITNIRTRQPQQRAQLLEFLARQVDRCRRGMRARVAAGEHRLHLVQALARGPVDARREGFSLRQLETHAPTNLRRTALSNARQTFPREGLVAVGGVVGDLPAE